MRLRPAVLEDAESVAALWRASIRGVCAPAYRFDEAVLTPWVDSKTPECVASLIRCEEFFLVAADADGIAGFICGTFALGTFALYVHPDRQRRGVGSRLFRAYENLARASGFRTISFHSTLNAVTFYQKMGARIDGGEIAGPRPAIPMRKEILP